MLQPQDTLSPYPYIWPFENFMLCIKAKP
jgi:hypothetical protein